MVLECMSMVHTKRGMETLKALKNDFLCILYKRIFHIFLRLFTHKMLPREIYFDMLMFGFIFSKQIFDIQHCLRSLFKDFFGFRDIKLLDNENLSSLWHAKVGGTFKSFVLHLIQKLKLFTLNFRSKPLKAISSLLCEFSHHFLSRKSEESLWQLTVSNDDRKFRIKFTLVTIYFQEKGQEEN